MVQDCFQGPQKEIWVERFLPILKIFGGQEPVQGCARIYTLTLEMVGEVKASFQCGERKRPLVFLAKAQEGVKEQD